MTEKRWNGPKVTTKPYRLGMLILPQFSNLGLGLTIEPLFVANWLNENPLFEWKILSTDGKSVQASNGMTVPVDAGIAEIEELDSIFVFASFEPREATDITDAMHWLRRLARFGAEVGGIETGSELLAAAGLLDGKEAAVHWDNIKGFQELYPKVKVKGQLYTLEPGRFTCAGATAIMDLMLNWMGQRIPYNLVMEVSHHLLKHRIRRPEQSQQYFVDDEVIASPPVRHAIEIMHLELETPISCAEIAERVGLSRRQLERQFKRFLGTTPLKYYLMLRLSKAHQLLQQTDMSVTDIALSAGFESPEHFSRLYREMFGRPPSTDRMQATDAPVMRHTIPSIKY